MPIQSGWTWTWQVAQEQLPLHLPSIPGTRARSAADITESPAAASTVIFVLSERMYVTRQTGAD